MIIQALKDILSSIDFEIVDNIGIEKIEKVRVFILKNNLDKILIYHITDHINTMIENLFHESNEKLKEDCIELRKLLIYWYDDRYANRFDKNNYVLSIFSPNSSE